MYHPVRRLHSGRLMILAYMIILGGPLLIDKDVPFLRAAIRSWNDQRPRCFDLPEKFYTIRSEAQLLKVRLGVRLGM